MSDTISKVCFVLFYFESAVCVADAPQQSSQPPSTRTKHDKQIEQLNLPEDTTILARKGTYYGWPPTVTDKTRRGKGRVNVSLIL